MRHIILTLAIFPYLLFSQSDLNYQQTQDIQYYKNIKNGTKFNSYTTKNGLKISKGDIITIGRPFSKKENVKINDEFKNIVVGDVSGTYIHDYKYLNQKYKDEQVIVSEIYVTHEKYKGYKLLYNKKEMPLYVSIYVKSANKSDNISSFFGDSKKTILNIEKALIEMEIINPNAPLSREEAIKKLRESKDLMELDMMSKEEYEKLKKKLTPIIKQ
ncbi:MAG: hypothetical protein CMD36_06375 [Flavobacteriales bacterium]|nr:hypothetical protein [Flavobacteriales bacterium]